MRKHCFEMSDVYIRKQEELCRPFQENFLVFHLIVRLCRQSEIDQPKKMNINFHDNMYR